MNRNPILDGWRGIAIALVLVDHIQDSLLHHYVRSWSSTGYHGVTIFFVLSGFLITSKLLEGPISFRRFYLRRFFRLMPAAWLFLASLLLLSWLTRNRFTSLAEVAACIFFCRNFFGQMGVAGHFWSLSVEEQFYLVWPVTLLLAGSVRARWIVGLGAVCCAVFRFLSWGKYSQSFPTGPTFLHADGLLVGCLLALLLADERTRGVIARWSKHPGPTATTGSGPHYNRSLQSVISIFKDEPRVYNLATYAVCLPLLLIWMLTTFRFRFSPCSSPSLFGDCGNSCHFHAAGLPSPLR